MRVSATSWISSSTTTSNIESARKRKDNDEFLKYALQVSAEREEVEKVTLSVIEKPILSSDTATFSREAIEFYLKKINSDLKPFSDAFWKYFETIGMVERSESEGQQVLKPTGFGILLFGEKPRDQFPQAGLKAKVKYGTDRPIPQEFAQPLVMIPLEVENWLKKVLHSNISREGFERQTTTDFPIEPLREAIVNALVVLG